MAGQSRGQAPAQYRGIGCGVILASVVDPGTCLASAAAHARSVPAIGWTRGAEPHRDLGVRRRLQRRASSPPRAGAPLRSASPRATAVRSVSKAQTDCHVAAASAARRCSTSTPTGTHRRARRHPASRHPGWWLHEPHRTRGRASRAPTSASATCSTRSDPAVRHVLPLLRAAALQRRRRAARSTGRARASSQELYYSSCHCSMTERDPHQRRAQAVP